MTLSRYGIMVFKWLPLIYKHPVSHFHMRMKFLVKQLPIYTGSPIYLNQGKFRQNGGCGYVLKPKIMRDPNETGILFVCLTTYP